MHLKLCSKETCNRSKACTQDNTNYERKEHSCYNRKSRKVKYMTEYSACIDSLMHDDCRCRHTHTYHTTDRKIRTCKEDQTCNTKRKEHSRRCLLKDIQYIIVCKQRCMFYDRCDNTQCNEYQNDRNVQTVFQKELSAVERIFIILPLLRSCLKECKLRHTEHINQVILICICSMSSVFDFLQLLLILYLCIEQTVFVYVLFVFLLLMICKLSCGCLMFFFKLCNVFFVSFLCKDLFLCAAFLYRLIILLIKMCFQVAFCVCDQFRNLALVFLFYCFCFLQLTAHLCCLRFPLFLRQAAVSL